MRIHVLVVVLNDAAIFTDQTLVYTIHFLVVVRDLNDAAVFTGQSLAVIVDGLMIDDHSD